MKLNPNILFIICFFLLFHNIISITNNNSNESINIENEEVNEFKKIISNYYKEF